MNAGEDRAARRARQHAARRRAGRGRAARAARRRRRTIRLGVGLGATVVAVVVVIVVLAGSGDDTPEEPSQAVTVQGRDFLFDPDPALALAGQVNITLENRGSAGHELVVLRQGVHIAAADQFDDSMSLGTLPSIAPDTEATLRVELEPGTYQLVCLLPGHLEAGMESDLVVS